MSRNLRIVLTVLLLHGAALWALQTGLLRRTVELLVPAQVLVDMMASAETPTPQPQHLAVPTPAKSQAAPASPTPPAPMAVATAATQSSANAPAPVAPSTATTSSDRPTTTAVTTSSASVASPAPARVELPSSDADYLNNPKPPYPALSKRMGEQGKVVIRTLIGADGVAQEATIHQSSGFDRLDQAALATARKWRYVPGKRAGVAEAMWFNVPFTFVLE
jgi:protein TonB